MLIPLAQVATRRCGSLSATPLPVGFTGVKGRSIKCKYVCSRYRFLWAVIVFMAIHNAPSAWSWSSWPTPLPLGQESMYADINQGELAVADRMLEDYWPVRGKEPVYLPRPLTWTEDPYNDGFWRFMFSSLRYTSHLLWAYETTGETKYLDRLLELLSSFADYDVVRPYSPRTFDNEHPSAYRAMVLVNTYKKLDARGVLPISLASRLAISIQKLGNYLVNPKNFEAGFNHGFDEAAALLLIAHNFPEMDSSGTWRQTGITRLLNMLETNLDSDGVDIENSPWYHFYVMGIVSQVATWAEKWEPSLKLPYTTARQRMVHYAAMITQPNGRLPFLGATATAIVFNQDPAVFGLLTAMDPNFEWVFTRGAQGTPPPPGVELFPSAGLFILRSSTPPPDQLTRQTFITFDSGVHRTDHSQLDALSLTYYSDQEVLLPDSGLFIYYDTFMPTQPPEYYYFNGTRAHNTVVVDGLDQPPGAAIPGGYGRVGQSAWATGTSNLMDGVSHTRTVILLEQSLVVVVDSLVSTVSHKYTQTWHLRPNVSLEFSGNNVVAKDDEKGRPRVAFSQVDRSGLSLETFFGSESPMQGWYSESYGSKVKNWALEYNQTAFSTSFVTLIASGPYAAKNPVIYEEDVHDQNQRKIWVQAGATRYNVTLIAQGSGSLEKLKVERELVTSNGRDTRARRESCFIATAAYGSSLDPHVQTLRTFRDNVLLQSSWGSAFVRFYYHWSPPAARLIARQPLLKGFTRLALAPVIFTVENPNLTMGVIMIGFIGVGVLIITKRTKHKIKKWHRRSDVRPL